jgi:hypothetical protein
LGNVSSGAITIGGVNEHFVGSPEVKEGLISIFVERLLNNSKTFPWPDEFMNVSVALFEATNLSNLYYPHWNGDFTKIEYWTGTVADGPTFWLGRGILKPGRLGDLSYSRQSFMGILLESALCAKATVGNDFGDFVAFILTKTVAEKEDFYAYVRNLPPYDTYGDARLPQGGPEAEAAIRQKVQIVKNYFKEHVGIELKDPS